MEIKYVTTLNINLGIIKNFLKGINYDGTGFQYFCPIFISIFKELMRDDQLLNQEGNLCPIFISIFKELMRDDQLLNQEGKRVWSTIEEVITKSFRKT